jgi:hypothetical protein
MAVVCLVGMRRVEEALGRLVDVMSEIDRILCEKSITEVERFKYA